MFSMMSISPHAGQPTVTQLSPSIQKAGQALPARDLNPCFHAPVAPRAQPLGLESGGRVVTISERLTASLDDEVAACDTRVFGAVGVELELRVAPAAAPGLADP